MRHEGDCMLRKAIVFSLLTAFISGISVFANGIFVTKADPILFAFVRNILVAVFLTGLLLGSHSFSKLKSLTRKEWGKLMAIGVIGGGIPFALFFSGLAQIGAVNGTIIHKSMFLWVALLAIPFLGETVGWMTILGYGMVFIGTFVIGGTFSIVPSVGTFMVLGATVLWATEQIVAKRILKTVSPTIVAWGRMIFGLPFLFGACVVSGSVKTLTPAFFQTASMALVASSVLLTAYMVTWFHALKRAPATLVSSILVLAPIITIALQAVIFHKTVQSIQFGSLALAVVGVSFVAIPFVKRHMVRT
jgi:drug/metabolite transporter (DMT)-like permease